MRGVPGDDAAKTDDRPERQEEAPIDHAAEDRAAPPRRPIAPAPAAVPVSSVASPRRHPLVRPVRSSAARLCLEARFARLAIRRPDRAPSLACATVPAVRSGPGAPRAGPGRPAGARALSAAASPAVRSGPVVAGQSEVRPSPAVTAARAALVVLEARLAPPSRHVALFPRKSAWPTALSR